MVRHPTFPFSGDWDGTHPGLFEIAARYLERAWRLFGLPDNLMAGRGADFSASVSGIPLAWLPITGGETSSMPEHERDPRNSFFDEHYTAPSGEEYPARPEPIDRLAVLFAVQSLVANKPELALRNRLGICIVAHAPLVPSGSSSSPVQVRITGCRCAEELAGTFRPGAPSVQALLGDRTPTQFLQSFTSDVFKKELLAAAGGRPDQAIWIDGLRVRGVSKAVGAADNEVSLDVDATLVPTVATPLDKDPRLTTAFRLTAQVSFLSRQDPWTGRIGPVTKWPLQAHAAPQANLFAQDPASGKGPASVIDGRPTRASERLAKYRSLVDMDGLPDPAVDPTPPLERPDLVVTQSPVVDAQANPRQPEAVELGALGSARTNKFAAASAYRNMIAGMACLLANGLQPAAYFQFAKLPLLVRYRDRMSRGAGRDGKTVNAEVDFIPPGCDAFARWVPPARPLEVKFALADLRRSASRREPLGLAADPRWSWHEFGHVLLGAATGALEFAFAHSAGDALAAIACDPASEFSKNRDLRGMTFPWVYLHRRHDRSVRMGWSWSGTFHRAARFPAHSECRRKGYQSEQILSTSLFRLYRALGGDTVDAGGAPDRVASRAASNYVLYLIMRGIRLAGWHGSGLIRTPDQFVSTLIFADESTAMLGARVGGCAHKVVRWAFEAQGLFAAAGPDAVINAPGRPPQVDIFIDDRRPDADADVKRGGYVPVSLDRHSVPAAWHASAEALTVVNDELFVQAGNRGQQVAQQVVVRALFAEWNPAAPHPPAWGAPSWTALAPAPSGPQDVAPGAPPVSFGPFSGLPARIPNNPKRYVIVAEATCAADRANSDPLTLLPCANPGTPLIDLVSGDNNLALLVHPI
jgi:hypothetical protein